LTEGTAFKFPEYVASAKDNPMVGDLMEVILYVGDMAQAVAFYRDRLGLRIDYPQRDDYRSEYWVVFETGSCKLCLHGGGEHRQGQDAPKIVFRVQDVQTARAQLMDRGVALSEVLTPSPGVLVCNGLDPDGNRFSIEQGPPH
jgi:predicted enzyme related to lactoylglutathione lyase